VKFNARNITRLLYATAYFVVGAELVISGVIQTRKVFEK
jgi:hypothetical protein